METTAVGSVDDPAPRSGAPPFVTESVGSANERTFSPRELALRLSKPAGYFVLSRIAVLFAALVSKWIFPKLNVPSALGDGWDGGWFVLIAQHGYPHNLALEYGSGNRWAFFPAYPASLRLIVSVTGLSYQDAAILASFLFGLLSAVAVWLMVRQVFGSIVADRTVLLYVFFPTAYVLSMAYSEGLYVACSCFCLYALARKMWVTAGCFALVGSLTRNVGLFLALAVVVAAVSALVRGPIKLRPILGCLLAPLGVIAWAIYAWHMTGSPIAFVKAENNWGGAHFVWFRTAFTSFAHLFSGFAAFKGAADVLAAGALVFIVVGLALLVYAQVKNIPIPTFWWVYTIPAVLVVLSDYWASSLLRLALVLIPLMAACAWSMRSSWVGPVVGTLAISQGALAVIILVGLTHPQATPLSP